MATPAPASVGLSPLPEEQMLELLVQLQKTRPEQVRAILNAQPAIGYALFPLMVRIGVVDLDILQKTLATHAESAQPIPSPSVQSHVPVVPPHVVQAQSAYSGQHSTPPPQSHTPSYPATHQYGYTQNSQPQHAQYPPHAQQQSQYPAHAYTQQHQYQQQYGQYPAQQVPQPQPSPPSLGALANIPEEQREMIMRVISMTPEQIARLPPQERAITMQLRATIGLPAE